MIIMVEIKLQFSVICEWSDGKNIGNIYNGFTPGKIDQFYIVNKWIWAESVQQNDVSLAGDKYYQETKIIEEGEKAIAFSKSNDFRVKNSHTHLNKFDNLIFQANKDYMVEVTIYSSQGELIQSASLSYPLFIRQNL